MADSGSSVGEQDREEIFLISHTAATSRIIATGAADRHHGLILDRRIFGSLIANVLSKYLSNEFEGAAASKMRRTGIF